MSRKSVFSSNSSPRAPEADLRAGSEDVSSSVDVQGISQCLFPLPKSPPPPDGSPYSAFLDWACQGGFPEPEHIDLAIRAFAGWRDVSTLSDP
jgi:hypothetical protein